MNALTNADREKIQRYLTLDVDELFSMIPPFLPEYEHTLFAPYGMLIAGKEYFEKIRSSLKKVICEDYNWPEKRKEEKFTDQLELVAAISDVIAAVVIGVPPFVIATIVVKMKLDDLCK